MHFKQRSHFLTIHLDETHSPFTLPGDNEGKNEPFIFLFKYITEISEPDDVRLSRHLPSGKGFENLQGWLASIAAPKVGGALTMAPRAVGQVLPA